MRACAVVVVASARAAASARVRMVAAVLALALALALVLGLPAAVPATAHDGAPISSVGTATSTACPVRDLPPTDLRDLDGTHGDAVRCLAWYGLTAGQTPTSFGSTRTVTRGQVASLLVRTAARAGVELPRPERRAFPDTAGSVHGDAAERLAAAGVLRGTTEGRADLHTGITRGQLATLLVGTVERVEGRALPRGPDAFDDDDGHRHEPAIDAAAAAGFVAGVGGGAYLPDDRLTRAQSASVLARWLERLAVAGEVTVPDPAPMRWEVSALPAEVRAEMTGVSWQPGCPVGLGDLRLVVLTHRGFDGRQHRGELVVHRSVATDLGAVFRAMFAADVPLARVERIERFGGDDGRSMAANNTSAFNCRRVTSGSSWSEHAYGTAIDLNPVQNPYVRGSTVLPAAGRAYLDRASVRPGMIVEGDVTVRAFDAIGWGWGGRWSSARDHQHFSRSGR